LWKKVLESVKYLQCCASIPERKSRGTMHWRSKNRCPKSDRAYYDEYQTSNRRISKSGCLAKATRDEAQVQAYGHDALGRRVKVEGSSSVSWTVSLLSGQNIVYEVDWAG
jgi:hypothetical protein